MLLHNFTVTPRSCMKQLATMEANTSHVILQWNLQLFYPFATKFTILLCYCVCLLCACRLLSYLDTASMQKYLNTKANNGF